MHAFEQQDTRQTLADGIAEYYHANPEILQGRGMSAEAQEFFRCHDAVHVVYGCGNTMNDEAVVKLSSMVGTTGSLGVLRGYKLHESRQIYKTLPVIETIGAIVQSIVIVPRTIFRCIRQRSRWPWNDFEKYQHVPLCEIRAEFGIRVAHASSSEADSR